MHKSHSALSSSGFTPHLCRKVDAQSGLHFLPVNRRRFKSVRFFFIFAMGTAVCLLVNMMTFTSGSGPPIYLWSCFCVFA